MNCIYNASYNGISLNNSTLYVHGLPVCSECAKGVIQVGIKKVIMRYPSKIDDRWISSFNDTSNMFTEAKVKFICYEE